MVQSLEDAPTTVVWHVEDDARAKKYIRNLSSQFINLSYVSSSKLIQNRGTKDQKDAVQQS